MTDRPKRWLACLILLVLPLGLRLAPVGHGLPRNYVPDTHAVRNALGMARDRDLVPPAGRYSSYPYLFSYALLPAYALQFAGGLASGAWSDPAGFARHALERPGDVQLAARLVTALLGALTACVVFAAARAAGLTVGAWLAAWLAATSALSIHFSVQERPWVPMVFCQALAAWAAIVHARGGSLRSLVVCAGAAGLAAAMHQAGLFTAALVVLAALCAPAAPGLAVPLGAPRLGRLALRLALAAAVLGLVALLLGHPYRLRYGPTPVVDVVGGAAGAEASGIAIGGQRMLFSFSPRTFAHLAPAFLGYDPLLALAGIAGLVLAVRARPLRAVALFAAGWAAFFLVYHNDHVRYLLPLSALFALTGGLALERLWRVRAARPAVLAALALPLVLALRLDHVLARADTRADGEALLAALPPGAKVAIDRYGPEVELSRASLERLAELRAASGGALAAREQHRLELLRAGGVDRGVDALRVEDLFAFEQRGAAASVRPEVARLAGIEGQGSASLRAALAAEGATHLLLVETRPGAAHALRELVEGVEPSFVIDPRTSAHDERAECVLPLELDFAWTALWRVDRPGPRLSLWRLE